MQPSFCCNEGSADMQTESAHWFSSKVSRSSQKPRDTCKLFTAWLQQPLGVDLHVPHKPPLWPFSIWSFKTWHTCHSGHCAFSNFSAFPNAVLPLNAFHIYRPVKLHPWSLISRVISSRNMSPARPGSTPWVVMCSQTLLCYVFYTQYLSLVMTVGFSQWTHLKGWIVLSP